MNDIAKEFYDNECMIRPEVFMAMHMPQGFVAWSSIDMDRRRGKNIPPGCPRELDPRLR
jgi:hypothetical protein